jgi:hypothetical protein
MLSQSTIYCLALIITPFYQAQTASGLKEAMQASQDLKFLPADSRACWYVPKKPK